MKVLVTGSSGFIGSHLVRALVQKGHSVSALDCVTADALPQGVRFHQVDLRHRGAVVQALQDAQPEALVHLAARTDVQETRDLSAYDANMAGVSHLLEAVRQTPTLQRAIYASTQLVCRLGYIPKHDTDFCSDTLYGASKVETERRIRADDGGGVRPWVIVRPTTIWGPGMNPLYLPFFRMIARGRYMHVTRRPLRKSYGFIGNTVHQLIGLLNAPAESVHRRVLYLADYEPLSMRVWAEAFRERMHARRIPTIPAPVAWTLATTGSLLWSAGWKSVPLTRYRLHNMLTEYLFDMTETASICGPLPFDLDTSVDLTWSWLQSLGIGPQARVDRGTVPAAERVHGE